MTVPVLNFKSYDPDKMIKNKVSVEALINQSFNSIVSNNYQSSRLGNSMMQKSFDVNKSQRSFGKMKSSQELEFPNGSPTKQMTSTSIIIKRDTFINNDSNTQDEYNLHRRYFNGGSNLNDLSISFIQTGEKSIGGIGSQSGLPMLKSSVQDRRGSLLADKQVQAKSFKKFTYRIQGKDETGADYKANEEQFLNNSPEQFDNSSISITDEKLLEEINLGETNDTEGIDESVGNVQDNLIGHQLTCNKNSKLFTEENNLNINILLEEYYWEEKTSREEKEKLEKLKQEMNFLRDAVMSVEKSERVVKLLQNEIETNQLEFVKMLHNEKKKMEILDKLKSSKLTELDRLRILAIKDEEDFDKFVEFYENTKIDKETNIDEQTLMDEMEKIKKTFDEKSSKYQEIIRKLKKALKFV